MYSCIMKFSLVIIVLTIVKIIRAQMNISLPMFASATNDFALSLLKELHTDGNNVFISPLSISAMTAMMSLGAMGTTLNELNFNPDEMVIHKIIKDLINNFQEKRPSFSLEDRLFPQNDLELIQQFLGKLENYYKTSVEKVDFNSSEAENIVNRWASLQTDDEINDCFVPESTGFDTVFVLSNAIYFKYNWKNQFDRANSQPRTFHVSSMKTESPMMMGQTTEFFYTKDDEYKIQILELPYKDTNFSMLAILPELGKLHELFTEMTAYDLNKIINSMEKTQVRVHFPKFKMETKYEMEATLSKLEMKNLFTDSANLSRIIEIPAKVSTIIHRGFIRVNEEETDTTAATEAEMKTKTTSQNPLVDFPEFIADHPFLFFIIDKSNYNIIVFAGTVDRPQE